MVVALLVIVAGGGWGKSESPSINFPESQSVFFISHRGAEKYFPENTMESFEAARVRGFKGIETDITTTVDDTLVIFHDENCKRLLGIDTPVTALTTMQLRNSHILFYEKPSSSTVLMLDDLFRNMRNRMIIYLDIKLHDTKTADKIVELIKKYKLESSTIVANSNMLFIAWVEFFHPEINTSLEGFNPGKEWTYTCTPKKFRPDFLASFSDETNAQHMEWLRINELSDKRIVYGVTEANFRHAMNTGIRKIIMDYDSTLQDEISKNR